MRKCPGLIAALIGMSVLSTCSGGSYAPAVSESSKPLPADSMSGTVTFQGAPLPGAVVTAWVTNTNSVFATATTDAGGNYSFTGIQTSGNVPLELNLWVTKAGYGFYPSVGAGARVVRYDHTGQFVQTGPFGVPMYFTVIDYVALTNASLTSANFAAYDGADPVVAVAATGQAASYADGDDAALSKGVAWPVARFTDNRNGTVTDHLTGLIWLQNAGCFEPAAWSNALSDANQLANGACGLSDGSAGGDWRLPNLFELESLIDVSVSNPALTPGHPFSGVSNFIYWTSTSYFGGQAGSGQAWAMRMSDGRYINDSVQNVKTTSQNAVWAVRGVSGGSGKLQATGLYYPYQSGDDGTLQKGVPLIFPRFIENGDGTVTDSMTGLIWAKVANCIQGDWATAAAAVRNLASGQCGLTDHSTRGSWRMPNRNEMQGLADRNQNNESEYLNQTFLNPDQTVFQTAILIHFISGEYYWTSTTDAANPNQAWTVFSCDFGVYDIAKSAAGYTLAVR